MSKNQRSHNEECFVLVGRRRKSGRWRAWRIKYSVGQPCSVNFNPDWVLQREEAKGDIIGWWHTHPNMTASPSRTDYATMQAWVCCFGKPLLCCIEGRDGLRAHWFYSDEEDHIEGSVRHFGGFFWGVVPEFPPKPKIEFPTLEIVSSEEEETFEELNAIQKGVIYVE
jgi:hypothetical protein